MVFVCGLVMAKVLLIVVSESAEALKKAKAKAASHQRARLEMLQLLAGGISDTTTLASRTGAGRNTIVTWKKRYGAGGLAALLGDGRGGDKRSGLSGEQKQIIAQKMQDPEDAFTSYTQAQRWLEQEHGIVKNYQALNKYLKRNFGAKLKVGRKSHLKKDEAAVAVFKKPGR